MYTEITEGQRKALDSSSQFKVEMITHDMWSEIMIEIGFDFKPASWEKSPSVAPWIHSKDSSLRIQFDYKPPFDGSILIVIHLGHLNCTLSLDRSEDGRSAINTILQSIRNLYPQV